jgi:hypothetical protein
MQHTQNGSLLLYDNSDTLCVQQNMQKCNFLLDLSVILYDNTHTVLRLRIEPGKNGRRLWIALARPQAEHPWAQIEHKKSAQKSWKSI